LLNHRV